MVARPLGQGLTAEDILRVVARCFLSFGKGSFYVFSWGFCLPGLSSPTSGHLCQANQQSSLNCLELKLRRAYASSEWWKQQNLKSGSTHQPGSQPLEEDRLSSREGRHPRRKVKSWLKLSPFPICPRTNFTLILL